MIAVEPALLEHVRARLVAIDAPPTAQAIGRVVRDSGLVLDRVALAQLTTALADELGGLGPLDELVRDPAVSDVLVNSPDEVWVDRGAGLVRAPAGFRDEAAVRQLAVRLAARAGRRLDDAQPFVDARLPDWGPAARGPPAVGLARHDDLPANPQSAPVRAARPGRQRDRRRAGRGAPRGRGALPCRVPGDRRNGVRQDLGPRGTAGTGRARRADRHRRGHHRAAPRPSACGQPGVPAAQRGGHRRGVPADVGPAGAADAPGPARRRGGPGCRGGRHARRVQHGSRGRVRDASRELRLPRCRTGWRPSPSPPG